jgi:hypothetical protein
MAVPEINSAMALSAQGPRIEPSIVLPDHSRSVDAAQFDQLFQRALNEHAKVEFTNPVPSIASPGVDTVTRSISGSSSDFLNSVEDGMKSLSHVNLQDPRTFADLMGHFTNVAIRSVQMSTVLGEVSSAKKSLQELFHNQG